MKHFLFISGALILIFSCLFIGLRLLTHEDTWICVNGEWVKHGFPFAPKPKNPCPGFMLSTATPTIIVSATSTAIPVREETGRAIFEGSLSYPSEGIPDDLGVCAEEVKTKISFCTNEHLKDMKYSSGFGYKLEVSSGEYYVYAITSSMRNYKAYYSEFVTCGLKAECKSHEPILVEIKDGDYKNGIDPQDWYMPSSEVIDK